MACLFGHKWNGCKCAKCGEVRNEQHQWDGCKCRICGKTEMTRHKFIRVEGKDEEQCSVCGMAYEVPHKITNGACVLCGKGEEELKVNLANEVKSLMGIDNLVDAVQTLCKKYEGLNNIEDILLPACKIYGESFSDLLAYMNNMIVLECGIKAAYADNPLNDDMKGLIYKFMFRLDYCYLLANIPVREWGASWRFPENGGPRLLSSWKVEKCLGKLGSAASTPVFQSLSNRFHFFPNQTDFMPFINSIAESFIKGDYQPVFDLQTKYAVEWLNSQKLI